VSQSQELANLPGPLDGRGLGDPGQAVQLRRGQMRVLRAVEEAGLSLGEARKVMGDGLLDEIEDLMGRIRSREFYEGSGWDDRIHAERAFRDESWASEMDALFDGASDAFQAGRLDTRYPRHVAFRRELDRLCASSPAVGRP
jgi:hypothetical protein